jgi:hypothetical protein
LKLSEVRYVLNGSERKYRVYVSRAAILDRKTTTAANLATRLYYLALPLKKKKKVGIHFQYIHVIGESGRRGPPFILPFGTEHDVGFNATQLPRPHMTDHRRRSNDHDIRINSRLLLPGHTDTYIHGQKTNQWNPNTSAGR